MSFFRLEIKDTKKSVKIKSSNLPLKKIIELDIEHGAVNELFWEHNTDYGKFSFKDGDWVVDSYKGLNG